MIELTAEDRGSALWRKLVEHYTERLESLRVRNDGDLDDVRTARVRGRIAECKELLALSADEPVQAGTDFESRSY